MALVPELKTPPPSPSPPPWPPIGELPTITPPLILEVLSLDLHDLFELTRPGRYRVEVAFDDIRTGEGQPGRVSAIFTLAPAAGLAE